MSSPSEPPRQLSVSPHLTGTNDDIIIPFRDHAAAQGRFPEMGNKKRRVHLHSFPVIQRRLS